MNIQGISSSGQLGISSSMGMGGPGGMAGPRGMRDPMGGNEDLKSAMLDKLSEATGLSTDDLKTSFKDGSFKEVIEKAGLSREDMDTLRTEVIDEAVAAGEINETEADKMKVGPKMGPPPPPMGGQPPMGADAMQNAIDSLAEELGYDSGEDFLSAIPEGSSPWAVAQQNGLDMEQYLYNSLFDVQV